MNKQTLALSLLLALLGGSYVVIQIWITDSKYGAATEAFPAVVLIGTNCSGVVFAGDILLTAKHCPVAIDDVIRNHDKEQVARAEAVVARCSTSELQMWKLKEIIASLVFYATVDASDLADNIGIRAVAFGPTMLSVGLSPNRKKRYAEGAVVEADCKKNECGVEPAFTARLTAGKFCEGDSGGAIYTTTDDGKTVKLAGLIQGTTGANGKCSDTDIASTLDSKTAAWIKAAGTGNAVDSCP